jgi:hypothetical protein
MIAERTGLRPQDPARVLKQERTPGLTCACGNPTELSSLTGRKRPCLACLTRERNPVSERVDGENGQYTYRLTWACGHTPPRECGNGSAHLILMTEWALRDACYACKGRLKSALAFVTSICPGCGVPSLGLCGRCEDPPSCPTCPNPGPGQCGACAAYDSETFGEDDHDLL